MTEVVNVTTNNGHVRRRAHPILTRQIWQSIGRLQARKLKPDTDSIIDELEDMGVAYNDGLRELKHCVSDRLVAINKRENEHGMESWEFSIPPIGEQQTKTTTSGTKDRDWYCFECHQGGLCHACRTCFRSYHDECVRKLEKHFQMEEEDFTVSTWQCPWCVYAKRNEVENDQCLNQCYNIIIKEIENEFQQELNMVKSTQSLTYYKNFVFRDTDIDKVKKTVQRGQIKFIDQLELEMRNLAHNYNCYFGANQLVTQKLDESVQATTKMLADMKSCINCFLNKHKSNNDGVNWFLEACKPPHKLCLAKSKPNGMMPAKIISASNGRFEVVFFGVKHEKTWLDHAHLKNLDLSQLKEGKKSLALKRALDEISEHIRNVKKRFGSEVLRKLKFESDGADIDDMYEHTQQLDDEQDDSSNSSTEKNKGQVVNEQQRKRPLRNRDSNQQGGGNESKTSKLHHDSVLFGIPISELSERVDGECQTPKEFMPTAEPEPSKKARRLDNADVEKIRREERKKSDDYYQKQLEDQKKQYQNEIRKTKKKQWCAVCSKEARYFCCSTAFYCTPECQRSHWTMGHSDVCKKRSAQPNGQHKSPITAQHKRG